MRKKLLILWKASQPYLKGPRLWVAVIMRKFLRKTTFIAITGSNGKTTTTRFLATVLSSRAPTQWTRLNRNSMGGLTETIAFCKPWKTRFAVFEVAAGQPDAINKAVKLVKPEIAVVLSVFLEHRSYFKTLEAVAREKACLLAGLPSNGLAVLNADDPLVRGMPVPPGRTTLTFGASAECDTRYENAVSAWPQLLKFTVVINGQRREIRTSLLGTHWVGAILACITVAHHLGIPLDKIASVIESVTPYPGRMQLVRLPSGAIVIRDEIKGSMHTIDVALDELCKATAKRKFLVFCDVGESARSPRDRLTKVGRRVAELVDYVIFIGDKCHHGVAGALSGGLAEGRGLGFPSYVEAAEFLRPILGEGDVVLLKADRNNQLPRLFYSLLEEVRCTIPLCSKTMVCDDCVEFRNPELVKKVNEQLTVRMK